MAEPEAPDLHYSCAVRRGAVWGSLRASRSESRESRYGSFMNKDKMKSNKGKRVLLLPAARRLRSDGTDQPPRPDDWWLIEDVAPAGVKISDPKTGYFRVLGYDHIQKFTSDQPREGFDRGFLTLHVQLIVRENDVELVPNSRPGEPVIAPSVADMVVAFQYPDETGLQRRLEQDGYRLHWSSEAHAPSRMAEGWSEVITANAQGHPVRLRTRDRMILLKLKG